MIFYRYSPERGVVEKKEAGQVSIARLISPQIVLACIAQPSIWVRA